MWSPGRPSFTPQQQRWGWRFTPPSRCTCRSAAALGLAVCGVLLDVSAMVVMARAHTTILPHHAASRLVTAGPFAWTRNPIYLGNTALLAGLGLATPARWFLPIAPAAAFAIDRLAIRREEAHLRARFGAAWDAYARVVPRWIGFAPGARR
jgi:protein-S-isoprenylcysteine O-methyltransferase Ste14